MLTREWDRATRAAVAAETIVVSVAKREDVNPTATAMVVEGDGGGFEIERESEGGPWRPWRSAQLSGGTTESAVGTYEVVMSSGMSRLHTPVPTVTFG